MKFEITEKNQLYTLEIDGEKILTSPKLGEIVNKIEAYLKMRYLREEEKGGFISKLLK